MSSVCKTPSFSSGVFCSCLGRIALVRYGGLKVAKIYKQGYMKKKGKDFTRFTKRNTHKRRAKEKSRAALLSIIEGMGVAHDGVHIGDVRDEGRRGRSTGRAMRDEVVVEGIYSGARGGFGFVALEDESQRDIFIPEGKNAGAIDGDYVEVIYHTYRGYNGEEKTEGRVRKIIKIGREFIVGTLDYERTTRRYGGHGKRRLVLIPDEPRISILPLVMDAGGAEVGDKVAARLDRQSVPTCVVTAVLGAPDSREANYAAILLESGIPTEFSEEALTLADAAAKEPIDYEAREDRRDDIILTIDGAGAKDLDDAVSLRRTSSGWMLGVHIADVSHYVKERTALDRAVMERGTSVYFTDKVVPMLPEALSNGACSLNAGEDKCALSAFIRLDRSGGIIDVRITPTVIRSRVRGVYSEVNAIFDGTLDTGVKNKYKPVMGTLTRMRELYLVLLEKSKARGMLELDIPEAAIVLDESGQPTDIYPVVRGIGEKMIEQFMLVANEAVATKLTSMGIPCVFRVHENPPEEKMREFMEYAANLGLDIRGLSAEAPDRADLSRLLREAEERGLYAPVSYLLLRSLSKAKYSEARHGHFGLGIENYCHFTSPIRRLSDLATHRIIRRVLVEGKSAKAYTSYARRAAVAATDAELRAVSAERKIEDLYKVIYMRDKVGECFEAVVSSVASFGVFAMLQNTCEGLVPIEEMRGYFVYDEKNMCVRSGDVSYRVGDRIKVRLEEVDMARCKLRFAILSK